VHQNPKLQVKVHQKLQKIIAKNSPLTRFTREGFFNNQLFLPVCFHYNSIPIMILAVSLGNRNVIQNIRPEEVPLG